VIIPVMAGGLEYFANAEMVGKILEVQAIRDDLQAAFLLTRHNPRLKLSKKITGILSRQGLPVMKNFTSNRVAYSESSLLGKSITEYMHKAAREEWLRVFEEITALNSACEQADLAVAAA
jgi:cellulose biosynthesis protein BcsQ